MSFIDSLPFAAQDPRVRKFLFPQKILKTWGSVRRSEELLKQKPLQIGLSEPDTAVLSNKGTSEKAAVLLDFGIELHGGIRILNAYGADGKYVQVRLSFGESAMEAVSRLGDKNATNDHATRDMTVSLPELSDLEFGQTGFRFVLLQLLTPEVELQLKAVAAVFVYRELEYLGSFACSDGLLNKIYDTAAYTCHLNMQNMLWDGIKRDRLVWIGDMHPEMLTIRSVFGENALVEDSLDFVREQTPLPMWMNHYPSYSMWWLIILWDWFLHNGNRSFLERQREYAISLIQQIVGLVQPDGSDTIPVYFLDWPTCGTQDAVIGTRSLLMIALQKAEKLAECFEEPDIAALCRDKWNVMNRCFSENSSFKSVTAFQVLAGAKSAAAVNSQLIKDGAAGMCTFLSYYIMKAMARGGSMENTLAVMKEYYGAMLDKGATTFWEDFDIKWLDHAGRIDALTAPGERDLHGDNGSACYVGYRNSLCHGWSSGPVPFLAEQVLGIHILEPGCKKLAIVPRLGNLEWAKGSYPTPYGVIRVSHQMQQDHTIKTKIEAPKEIEIAEKL